MRHSENYLRLACEEVRSRDERVYFYDKWFLVWIDLLIACKKQALHYNRTIALQPHHCNTTASLRYNRVIALQPCYCATTVLLHYNRVIALQLCHCTTTVSSPRRWRSPL
jgi:hypothetical protein